MRKVELRMNEQQKYEIIKAVVDGKKKKQRAQIQLDVSRRQINRMINNYSKNGKIAFLHGNRGRLPKNSKSLKDCEKIIELYKGKYRDANFTHFTEKLNAYEGIIVSESKVRQLMKENDIISPKANRTTKRNKVKRDLLAELLAKKNEELKVDDIETITELTLADVHPSRPRKKNFGELIQMDASEHIWFGDKKSQLHAAIDDASGKIVGLFFDPQETLYGYYMIYKQILVKYGIPYEFLTDKRTVFDYKRKNASPSVERDTSTQFGYACKRLGTHITTTSVPQAKGRVERLFSTLQSRLIIELRIRGITSINAANEFLPEFIEEFNSKFALHINDTMNVFETVENIDQIDMILAVLSPRTINKGCCLRYNKKVYYPERNGERRYLPNKTKVLVIKSLNGDLFASVGERIYALMELDACDVLSPDFDMPSVKQRRKEKYIPPMSHPWKLKSFEKYVNSQRHYNEREITQMFD